MTDPGHFRPAERDEYYFEEGCYILELLNDPGDPQASVARARVPAGGATRRHRLLGTTERYLILQGSGEAHIGDMAPMAVQAGDALLIPPGTAQRITNLGSGDLVFLAICTPRFQRQNYRAG